jgi:hypothetical protein
LIIERDAVDLFGRPESAPGQRQEPAATSAHVCAHWSPREGNQLAAGGVEIRAEVRAEPPTDLLLEVVSEGQVLARTHARAGSVRRKLPPLTPVFSRDASWRALSHAVARAREATSERLLAETKVEQRDQLCH